MSKQEQGAEQQDSDDPKVLRAEIARLQAELAKLRAERDKTEEATERSADIAKQLDDTRTELAQVLKREKFREWISKAQKFSALGKTEHIAHLLAAADEHLEKGDQTFLHSLLAGATERVEKGELFSQLADPDAPPSPASWEDRLAEAARNRVAKGQSPTVEQAKVTIMNEDDTLRREYSEAMRSR